MKRTCLHWAVGMLNEFGPMSSSKLAAITGWNINRTCDTLRRLQQLECARPRNVHGVRQWVPLVKEMQ